MRADALARRLDVSECGCCRRRHLPSAVRCRTRVRLRHPEDLAKNRTHRTQRVELAALDLFEQPHELRVLGDGGLEMPAGAGGGDGEDLGREISPTALLEPGRRAVG